ncbi:MAG: N-formylglutamate amidohydrolase [Hyphomicrobiales bacterium]
MPADSVFEIIAPAQWTAPMVFSSPHSGDGLPQAFLEQSKLSADSLLQSRDTFVDELFGGCVAAGAPLLRALLARSYIDLNREPFELDPRMFIEHLPPHFNSASPRVACGLGTLPRIVAEGQDIYRGRMPLAVALQRIEDSYKPYHRALAALLNEAHQATGVVLLVDCHSMPASAVAESHGGRLRNVDVVLGDRHGCSALPEMTAAVEALFTEAGLSVARNRPYAGGFSTENNGQPRLGRHALQIEINRSLYMDERRQEKTRGFDALRQVLDRLAERLATLLTGMMEEPAQPLAAE